MFKDLIEFTSIIAIYVILILVFLITPFIYLNGTAKSAWLQQTQNINLPWYQAAFIDLAFVKGELHTTTGNTNECKKN